MNDFQRNQDKPWIIAITGASGTIYARRLIMSLLDFVPDIRLEVVISEAALRVMREEENLGVSLHLRTEDLIGFPSHAVTLHHNRNIAASIASGSYPTNGMVIVPCSMSTLAAVANGFASTLIHRAADVVLKEGRQLILVPRETPLSVIHLENLLKLARLGVRIVPAMPGFYHQPKIIEDLVDMMVMRIIDQMGFHLALASRWTEEKRQHIQQAVHSRKA